MLQTVSIVGCTVRRTGLTSSSAGVNFWNSAVAAGSCPVFWPGTPASFSAKKTWRADNDLRLTGSLSALARSSRSLTFCCSSGVKTFLTRFLGAGFFAAGFFAFFLGAAFFAAGFFLGAAFFAVVAVFLGAGFLAAAVLTAFFTVAVGLVARVVVAYDRRFWRAEAKARERARACGSWAALRARRVRARVRASCGMSCWEALGASAAKRHSAPASIPRIRGRVVGARGGGIDERRRSSGRAIDGVFRRWSVGGVTRGWELERLAGTSSKEGVVRHALHRILYPTIAKSLCHHRRQCQCARGHISFFKLRPGLMYIQSIVQTCTLNTSHLYQLLAYITL